MHAVSRREFLKRSALGAGAAALLSSAASANPLGLPIGCQTYPVRDAIGKDFPGTLAQLASMGYTNIEMCSPPGYEKSGFGTLVGKKGSELRKTIHDAGLVCESCHFNFRELKENLDDRIAWAKDLGLKQMILASFGLRPEATLSEWSAAADELNKAADKIQKAGMQTGFHNHNFEFKEIDRVLVYDKLMSSFDPKLVKMQFQVSVISLGYEAAAFMTKYPGRFLSMHLQDWAPVEKKTMAIGQGSVDWKKTFEAAKKGGIKNYFVELNPEMMRASADYLRGLKVS